ncbi:MAG: molybdate ABC transporter permease subunit [Cellvibrionaceae bacterium]|nr:molybdate ABC transporter permease subunit [Cellvibrionaceae bacterium]
MLDAIVLTIKLALVSVFILYLIAIPIAYYLARSQSLMVGPIAALVSLPLILPPTVLGFYLLLAMGPNGPIGQLTESLGIGTLAFSFWGLVLGSVIYSLPFVVQPIQNAIAAIGERPLELAATMGAGPWDRFFTVILPLAKPGLISAGVLGFAHTVGEFGVVLMIGGNIPGETTVLSVLLYEQVEALQYEQAHQLAGGLLVFSFATLMLLYSLQGRRAISLFGSRP